MSNILSFPTQTPLYESLAMDDDYTPAELAEEAVCDLQDTVERIEGLLMSHPEVVLRHLEAIGEENLNLSKILFAMTTGKMQEVWR